MAGELGSFALEQTKPMTRRRHGTTSAPAQSDIQEAPLTTSREAQLTAEVLARTAEAPVLPMGDALFQRLLRHRIIFLGHQVDDELANRISAELILLAAEDANRDIHIYINSLGGSVIAGLDIYDVMLFVPNDVA